MGKYFVQVCTTTPCELCGSARIVEALKEELGVEMGGTTADRLFTLTEVECAGACVNAPVLAVNNDYYVQWSLSSPAARADALLGGSYARLGRQPNQGDTWGEAAADRPAVLSQELRTGQRAHIS